MEQNKDSNKENIPENELTKDKLTNKAENMQENDSQKNIVNGQDSSSDQEALQKQEMLVNYLKVCLLLKCLIINLNQN